MDKTNAEIQDRGEDIPSVSLLLIYILIEAPQDHDPHPQCHGLHKPQNLTDLIVGHTAHKIAEAAKKADPLRS